MDTSLSTAVAAAVVILLTCVYYWMKNRGVVPGPIGVPYLGLYPYLTNEDIHLKLDEYTRKYGDVFSFTYTGKLYINLGSIRAMREILLNKSDCFMDRFQDTHLIIEMLRNGVAFVNGEPWKVLRKFFIQKFKEYGLSTIRDNMAGPVYDSLNTAIEELKNLDGKEINIVKFLGQRSEVTIRTIIFGEKGITDENVRKIIALYIEVLEGNVGANRLLTGPLARLLFTIKPSFRKNLKACKKLQKLVMECVQKVERSMNENNPTCIVEEFYIERNKRRRANDQTWKYFSDDALVGSLIQFVGDGIHSVSAFIAGILNILLEYPDEQEKLHSEMMEVIGPNRQPSIEDKPNLPYTNAFINEYIRQTCMINFLPSSECTRETTIRGHRIPVGSIILYNFRSAHLDPDTFEDPEIFNPSRYMSSSGKPKAESPVIFGMGKRSCSGEAFVMLQIFLFLTTIVKNFKIVASNAPANSSTDFLIAEKLKLTFTPRTEN